jgi:diguanylate cyclase (GGDEF)-like protein/PAS domain S-box-containing protein
MAVSPHLLASLLDTVQEGVYHTDCDRRIVHWNRASQAITGHEADRVVGQRCQDRIVRHVDGSGRELCSTDRCPLLVPLRTGKPHEGLLYLHHADGHLIPVKVNTIPYWESSGQLAGVSQVYQPCRRDLRHAAGRDWKQEALTDALTGVGNRRRFSELWRSLRRRVSTQANGVGLLLVDIDKFKAVNDTHGHPAGDKVLKMVARSLAASLRDEDHVIRWGGEEFLVVVSPATAELLTEVAERLRQLVQRSWSMLPDGGHLSVTVSIGAALVRGPEPSAVALARADARLLACKAAGRNRTLAGD